MEFIIISTSWRNRRGGVLGLPSLCVSIVYCLRCFGRKVSPFVCWSWCVSNPRKIGWTGRQLFLWRVFIGKSSNVSNKLNAANNNKEEDYGGIAVVYIKDGSSADSKESLRSCSKISKSDSAKTEENLPNPAANETKSVTAQVQIIPEVNDKKTATDPSLFPEMVDGVLIPTEIFKFFTSFLLLKNQISLLVSTPTVEEGPNTMENVQDDYYFEDNYGEDQFDMDLLVDEVPFLDGPIGTFTNQELLPDVPMDDSIIPFHEHRELNDKASTTSGSHGGYTIILGLKQEKE
ncbi:hypothetical protein V2J09_010252 [Rumex salicifolius]